MPESSQNGAYRTQYGTCVAYRFKICNKPPEIPPYLVFMQYGCKLLSHIC